MAPGQLRYTVVVPAYYRNRQGQMFRMQRTCVRLGPAQERYVLRAFPVRIAAWDADATPRAEVARDVSADLLWDKLRRNHAIPTPEQTYEQLWQQLRVDLEMP